MIVSNLFFIIPISDRLSDGFFFVNGYSLTVIRYSAIGKHLTVNLITSPLFIVEDNGFEDWPSARDPLRARPLAFMLFLLSSPLFIVEDNGFEPLTPCVQGRCSSQLS